MVLSKAKRLSKVAREFNVGISTIVEFLNKKGYELDENPNAKVSPKCYDVLIQEYSKDYEIKKEKEEVTLRAQKTRNETITIDDIDELVNDETENSTEDIVIIKDTSGFVKEKKEVVVEKEKKEKVEEIKIDTKKAEVKVVGKIELKKKPKKVEEKKVEEEIPTEEKAEKKTPTKKEEKEIIIDDKKEESDLKVVGKIDLSSINQKTRPKKKTKEEKEEERKGKITKKVAGRKEKKEIVKEIENVEEEVQQKEDIQKESIEKLKIEEKKEEFIETKVKKLNGPTVVGKIELPKKEEKKLIANSTDKTKRIRKKKRKRIIKEPVNLKNKTVNQTQTKGKTDQGRFQKKGRRFQKKEVDEGEVQKQIKETLARLTSKGKSKGVKHRREKREEIRSKQQAKLQEQEDENLIIKVTEFVTANELATMMEVPVTKIIEACMSLGMFVSINQRLDAETISLVVEEFGYGIEFISAEVQDAIVEEVDKEEDLVERPPIVTVMGHVDHGKTSLLDYIRNTNIIAGEAGGITQHIGAYNVTLKNGKRVTFLDTPGHEAFTAMRARGAQVTDLAIIVIAADDKIMPQTIEAINHAQAASVPIVFAINKIDRPNANPEKVKEELAAMNYLVEDWGGKFQSKDISAKDGDNIDELMEEVFLATEMLELRANPNKKATGTIIESSLDKGRGFVATVLISNGTLKIGDVVLAGAHFGKVKAIFNERNQKIKEIGPAEPGVILGLDGAPNAGDSLNVMGSDREAREIATKREQLQREQNIRTSRHITLDEIGRRLAIGNFQELNIIVKGDVDGSVEALADSLLKLTTDEVQVNIIHKAVGQIAESDVMLAAASEAIIIGFQVRPSIGARRLAEKEDLEIRLYSIIYDAINEIKDAISGMLAPKMKEEITAMVEVMETFKITKVGTIAGCMVREGKINRNANVRIIRDGIVAYTGTLGSLKRFKDDVKEVAKGFECGLNIDKFNDVKVGDIIEAYHEVEIARD
ncbi:MAG: translation initiation factor IF-2 [Bacteroidetes bacterium]|nr:MAG: translation initiation factor IF-2 [Bacteroidota bacterium]